MSTSIIKILISQEHPEPRKEYCEPSLLEKCKYGIQRVESKLADDTSKEWKFLKMAYEKLSKKPSLSKEEEQCLYLLEPIIMRYANHDQSDMVEIDAEHMNRGVNHEEDESNG